MSSSHRRTIRSSHARQHDEDAAGRGRHRKELKATTRSILVTSLDRFAFALDDVRILIPRVEREPSPFASISFAPQGETHDTKIFKKGIRQGRTRDTGA